MAESSSSVVDESESQHFEKDNVLATSLAADETKTVSRLRLTVVAVLTSVAVTISILAFFRARGPERKHFRHDFVSVGSKLTIGFEAAAKQRLSMMEGFAIDMTAHGKNSGLRWPYVTLPDYQLRADHVARDANFMSLAFAILVQEEERSEFVEFLKNDTSQQEGLATQLGLPIDQVDPIPPYPDIVKFTPDGPVIDDSTGPFLVTSQVYPSRNATWRGNNLLGEVERFESLQSLITNGTYALSPSNNFVDSNSRSHPRFKVVADNVRNSKFGERTGVLYENDPVAPVVFPVFDEVSRNGHEDNRTVAGAILGGIYWRAYLSGLLPTDANGIDVVLRNTCGQLFTYRVDGLDASYVGAGDLHDRRYDDMASEIGIFQGYDKSIEANEKTSCIYSIQAFPSREFERKYVTSTPLYYAFSLAAVFAFTSVVFLLYDFAVEKRQRIVLRSALQSGAIVTSLFPEEVRERLFEEHKIHEAETEEEKTFDLEQGAPKVAPAIASSYPNCSVCFMDIAGFTKWSSSRTPAHVFDLLESAYAAFDSIASRRNVFKVETIGDCYVAVTGLPNEQPDHAIIMAKFASQCLGAFQHLVEGEIAERLGEDTRELALRVGLHSGEVVAGVLRGHKSRFQIFGDTVNVTARCESLGHPNRIHMSEATAKLLEEGGKSGWLSQRQDAVEAKGKGVMQTYWLNLRVSSSKSLTSLRSRRSLECNQL